MKRYITPSVQVYYLKNSNCLLATSQQDQAVASEKLEFCLKVSNNKEDTLSANKFNIGSYEGLKMQVTLEDKLDYVYYVMQKSPSQAVLFACVNEKGEIFDTFKDWSDDKLKVLSSSTPKLIAMIQNGRATRGDRFGLIPVQDKEGSIYDCAIRVLDFDWNTSNHAVELGRCNSIANQMLVEILKVLTELKEGDISNTQMLKIGAITFSESAKSAWKVVKVQRLIDTLTSSL